MTKRAAAKGPNLPKSAPSLGNLSTLYPLLVSCEFNRNEAPERAEETETKRFYGSIISSIIQEEESDSPHVAVCQFSAGHAVKDTKVLEIQATYYVAFKSRDRNISEADKRHVLKELAESAAWPLFRDLFIHIGSQSGEEIPMLPNVPKIEWRELEETAEEEEEKES